MCAEELILKNLSMLQKPNTSVDKDAQSRGSHWQNPVTGNNWANLTSPEDWETEDGGWLENLCIMGFFSAP